MAPSVWAQAKQLSDATNAPPPPDVWATPLDPQGAAIAAALPAKAPPSVWAPVDQLSGPVAPKVELAPQPQSPLQKVLEHQTSKLWADYDKDANPMGSANNHPGFWGKLAHGLNVATGGVNRRGWEENGLVKNIDTTLQDQSQNDLRGAQAKNFATENTLAPGKAASEEGLQGAQAGEANARANALENPPASTPELGTYRSLVALGMSPSDALKEIERDKALGLAPKNMEAKTLDVPGKGQVAGKVDSQGNLLLADGSPAPAGSKLFQQPNYGQMILPTKTATFIGPDGIPREYQWNEQTQTYDKPLGMSASNAYGHEAAQAGAVERAGGQLISDLEANKANLGTLGAWVKKYGLNTPIADPTLAGIQSQLASFAALNPAMHGARGTQAMQHFQDIIGGAQQNPDATIAAIRGIMKTAENINPGVNQGGGNEAPPAGAKVRDYTSLRGK